MEESFSPLQDLIAKRLLESRMQPKREPAQIGGGSKMKKQIQKDAAAAAIVLANGDAPADAEKQIFDEAAETAEEAEVAALSKPDFVRMEKNIAAFGFFTPSSKRIKNAPKIIKFTQMVDGNRVEAEVKISPNVEYGIPITADQDKYLAFQKIIERCKREKGKVENPITFSTAELIKLLGQSDAGLNFKEVYEWLDLMQGTQIKSQGAVWIAGKKRFATDVFNLFSRVKQFGDELDDGTIADKNYVWLSDWYLENLNAHYLLPLDFESYKKLKNNIAKALIPLLQIWLYASRETGTFEKRYSEICQVLNIKIYDYLSDIKRFFGRSLDELVALGYLADWSVEKTADETDFKIIFKHGYKFYADRRAAKQLAAGKSKRGANVAVAGRKKAKRAITPKDEKNSSEGQNFAAGEESIGESGNALKGNLPSVLTQAHSELIEKLHLAYQIAYEKAVELATAHFAETARQIEAFPFREITPKNKAGYLIEAIERRYSLPETYHEHLRAREVAAEQGRRQMEIERCPICDEKGWRNVKSEKDTFYGLMHQCTHDPEIENQFEDHKL